MCFYIYMYSYSHDKVDAEDKEGQERKLKEGQERKLLEHLMQLDIVKKSKLNELELGPALAHDLSC